MEKKISELLELRKNGDWIAKLVLLRLKLVTYQYNVNTECVYCKGQKRIELTEEQLNAIGDLYVDYEEENECIYSSLSDTSRACSVLGCPERTYSLDKELIEEIKDYGIEGAIDIMLKKGNLQGVRILLKSLCHLTLDTLSDEDHEALLLKICESEVSLND